ncbi:MAG: trypsin-like peptidase domain-containing protein [Myxococcota bacterium]
MTTLPNRDADALDAYSRAVVDTVDYVGPAVASVRIRQARSFRQPGGDGAGSAFAFTPDGSLVTNAHVVARAREVTVTFPDGEDRPARVVGVDPTTDLAVLEVAATGLPYLPVEDTPAPPRIGQLVVAIGNPFGFDATVSAGVLSAVDRTLPAGNRPLNHLLQHTAPINPGNSGGPLVDSRGRLLGVNVAILAVAQGIGFAVPAQTLAWVVPRLLHDGVVRRGYLGLSAHTWGGGARVVSVERRSPAAQAGIAPGDVLVGLGEHAIRGVEDLQRRVAEVTPGRTVEARLLRRGQERRVAVRPAPQR